MRFENKSIFYIILTIVLWSTVPAVAKLVLMDFNFISLIFYTTLFSIASLFVIISFQGKLKTIKNYKSRNFLDMAYMGFLGFFLYYIFLYGSFSMTNVAESNAINYLWPVFVVIFAMLLLKEKINLVKILGLLVSFFGAYLIFTGGSLSQLNSQYLFGYLLAFLGAVVYGLFSVLGKKHDYEKFTSIMLYRVFCLVFVIITLLFFPYLQAPNSLIQWLGIAWLGIFPNSLGFVFWFKSLKHGETAKMTNLIYLVPLISLIFIKLFLVEPITIFAFIGTILIVIGIFIQYLFKGKNRYSKKE